MTIWTALVVKFIAESAWCYRRIPAATPTLRISSALRHELLRLLAGRAVTLILQAFPSTMAIPELALYALLVFVRWPLWSIVAEILEPDATTLGSFLTGHSSADRRWRAGGILVSCLADLPAVLGGSWVGCLVV